MLESCCVGLGRLCVILSRSRRIWGLRVLGKSVVLRIISIDIRLVIDRCVLGSVALRPRLSSLVCVERGIGVLNPRVIVGGLVLAMRVI